MRCDLFFFIFLIYFFFQKIRRMAARDRSWGGQVGCTLGRNHAGVGDRCVQGRRVLSSQFQPGTGNGKCLSLKGTLLPSLC